MHHHPPNQERALSLSILTVSWQVGGQAVLGRQDASPTPWLTERHGYDPTCRLESRSLSELTRQIAPPTKNGHAPPPTESRKSSQSVNPYGVQVGGQAVLGRQDASPTPWLTERHGYDPTSRVSFVIGINQTNRSTN